MDGELIIESSLKHFLDFTSCWYSTTRWKPGFSKLFR